MLRAPVPRPLSIEEIEEVARDFKDDLQREVNRSVRRHDSQAALVALESMEHIDKFVYDLKLRAGSELGRLSMPARARPIHINPDLAKEKKRGGGST